MHETWTVFSKRQFVERAAIWALAFIFMQPANGTDVYDWKASASRALSENSEIEAAQSNYKAALDQERAAYSGFLPQLSANVAYNHGNSTVNNGSSLFLNGGNGGAATTSYSTSLTGTQNLFNGFQDVGKVRQGRANARVSKAVLALTRARILYNLASAFENHRYAKEYLDLTSQIIKRREENLRLVTLRFESGRENKGSVLLSQAYLNQSEYDHLQAENAFRVSKVQLAQAFSLDESADFEIAGGLPIRDPEEARPNFVTLIVDVPAYQQVIAQEESADAGITTARGGFFPTLNFTATKGRVGQEFLPTDTDRWSVGVVLNFPFFNGGRDFFGTRSAIETHAAAQSTADNLRRQLRSQLEQTYATFIEAVTKYRVDGSFKSATEVRAQVSRSKYNNGLLTFEDWDVIENDLISRQKTFLLSRRDRVIAEAAWLQVLGKGISE